MFDMDGDFVLGPAVDEAAEFMGQAEGAFVWLAQSAKALVDTATKPIAPTFMKYEVPMKRGMHYQTYAVVPINLRTFDGDDNITQILRTFQKPGVTVEILAKQQNTERFLRAAREEFRETHDQRRQNA